MKVYSNVDKQSAKFIETLVKKYMRTLRKKEYELNLPTKCPDIAADRLNIRNTPGIRSTAGADVINININYWSPKMFNEYKAFKDHPVIGSAKTSCWEDIMRLLVAHEVSHHVQYLYAPRVHRFKKNYKKPHGECFRQIYGYLRRDVVNPQLIKEGA